MGGLALGALPGPPSWEGLGFWAYCKSLAGRRGSPGRGARRFGAARWGGACLSVGVVFPRGRRGAVWRSAGWRSFSRGGVGAWLGLISGMGAADVPDEGAPPAERHGAVRAFQLESALEVDSSEVAG